MAIPQSSTMVRWKAVFLAFFLVGGIVLIHGGCREQEDRCGPVCVLNATTQEHECNLRAALIFTNSTDFEASMPKMQVVWELALQRVREMNLIPAHLHIVPRFYDDRCEQSHAIISAMDAHFEDCADVFFGPVCDYALASVGRIAKYLLSDGTPILTIGGNSYEYMERKTTCNDEFYMVTRAGFLNYKPLALFTVEIFKKFKWRKAVYFYEKDGQSSIAGHKTCHLTMSALAKYYKEAGLLFHAYTTDAFDMNLTQTLKREVGYEKTSEYTYAG